VSVRLGSLDWPVRALYTDSMATNGRAFSFADRSIHAHLSKRTVNFFCSHIAFDRIKHSRKVWGYLWVSDALVCSASRGKAPVPRGPNQRIVRNSARLEGHARIQLNDAAS